MKQKHLYITVAAAVLLICAAVVYSKINSMISSRKQQSAAQARQPQVLPQQQAPSAAPSIEDVAGRPGTGISQEPPKSLSQVYDRYPKQDTGKNLVAEWAKISPEDKTRVIEGLDQQISQAKEELKTNPQNVTAKQTLFINETLKKLCKNNFNYNLLESLPEDRGSAAKLKRKK